MADDVPELFRAHYLGLVRLALRLVDDQDSAEDVVQDVFAALRHPPTGNAEAYLRAAVVNRCRSALRRRRTARVFAARRTVARTAEAADATSLRRAEREGLLAAVRALPTRQREVVVLRYYEDLGVTEIADVLDTTPGAVSSALNRALAALAATQETTQETTDAD